jgi:hypothetical protein
VDERLRLNNQHMQERHMVKHIVTFDYSGISDPDDAEPLTGNAAFWQFRRELDASTDTLPSSVMGWRVDETTLSGMRAYAQFVTDDTVSESALRDLIQTHIYDEGGLTGDFAMGRAVPYEVVRKEAVIRKVQVLATSEWQAAEIASAGGIVLSATRLLL